MRVAKFKLPEELANKLAEAFGESTTGALAKLIAATASGGLPAQAHSEMVEHKSLRFEVMVVAENVEEIW